MGPFLSGHEIFNSCNFFLQLKLKELRVKQDKQEALDLLDMRVEADRLFAEKQTERQRNVRENYRNLQSKSLIEFTLGLAKKKQ